MLTTIQNDLLDRRSALLAMSVIETDAVPVLEDIDRPERWRRRAVRHVGTWLQAVLLVWIVGFAIVLVGIPIALIGRGVIELVSWIVGALR